jgi:carboxyl-terminal processing protease
MAFFLIGGIYIGGHPQGLPKPARDLLIGDSTTRVIDEGIDVINQDFIRPVNSQQLINDSLRGAVTGLHDRFSTYFTPAEYRAFQQSTEGEFSGVGVSVLPGRRGLRIHEVFPDSPAAKAGLRAGDLIVAVNGTSIAGKPINLATGLIKGRPGTPVTLTIVRGEQRFTRRMRRATVEVPVVSAQLRTQDGHKLAVVTLTNFVQQASSRLREEIDRALARGAQGVLLDLRGNGGGLLDEAVLVASIFIPKGTIVSTAGRNRPKQVFNATGGAISSKIPVVVLVDRGTASASEIVAGALQDRKRAQIVGTRTFGKGVFQQVFELSNGGALDLTVGEYFLPSGRNLGGGGSKQGSGVTPNVHVRTNIRQEPDRSERVALRVLAREVQ